MPRPTCTLSRIAPLEPRVRTRGSSSTSRSSSSVVPRVPEPGSRSSQVARARSSSDDLSHPVRRTVRRRHDEQVVGPGGQRHERLAGRWAAADGQVHPAGGQQAPHPPAVPHLQDHPRLGEALAERGEQPGTMRSPASTPARCTSIAVEFTDDPHPRNSYWDMRDLPCSTSTMRRPRSWRSRSAVSRTRFRAPSGSPHRARRTPAPRPENRRTCQPVRSGGARGWSGRGPRRSRSPGGRPGPGRAHRAGRSRPGPGRRPPGRGRPCSR